MLRLLAIAAAFALPSGSPATIAVFSGQVIGVAQDSTSIAWLESTANGCKLDVHSLNGGPERVVRYANGCLPAEHDLALALRGQAAWGGYEEVRCSETYADVSILHRSRSRLVQEIPGDCLGYGTSYQGLVSDGSSFFYSLLTTLPPGGSSTNCGEGGPCRWSLAGGRIVRIGDSGPVTVAGLPPAVLIAAAEGQIALVEPAAKAASNGRGSVDWPRAATGGTVEIRDTTTGRLVASFSPPGTVRAVTLSTGRAAVLVETPAGALRIQWYDSNSGERLGVVAVPRSTAHRISTDGRLVAFAVGKNVLVLDLATGAQHVVTHTTSNPVGLSARKGTLVWGENAGSTGRVLRMTA